MILFMRNSSEVFEGRAIVQDHLENIRTKRRMSRGSLARRLGVAEPTVWRWEKNGIKTSYEMLERMGEVLRVDPDDILLEAIPKPEEEVTHA